jgi:hypothetical protein
MLLRMRSENQATSENRVKFETLMVRSAAKLRVSNHESLWRPLIRRLRHNPDFRGEGPVHRALVGDFHQSLALIGIERALD